MDEKQVPYIVFEGTQARHERTVKRLTVALVVAIILMFLSNALWLHAWMQYDYYGEEIVVDSGDGTANYIGRDGRIDNGTYYSEAESSD